MFGFLKNIKENAFILLGILSLVFLLIYGIVCILSRRRGSWSERLSAPKNGATNASAESDSEGEKRTRAFLEKYFKVPFPKVRPSFLNNDVTGGKFNLELDCFNEDLKLGVEFNGRQHYEYIPYFHRNKEAFFNQKYRDKLKKIWCTEHGVLLIEIPYTHLRNLETWLEAELKTRGF